MGIPIGMPAAQRVAIVWALTLVVFAVFCAVFLPVHHEQRRADPANFLEYSRALVDAGEEEDAARVLRTGIDRIHPTGETPYIELVALTMDETDPEVEQWRLQSAFYQALNTGPGSRGMGVRRALDRWLAQHDLPGFNEKQSAYLVRAAETVAVGLDLPNLVGAESTEHAWALLRLCSFGALRTGRAIGDTGLSAPVDLLVVSGGGLAHRRQAQILVDGRDYATSRRGIHVALIDPNSGEVVRVGEFDTWAGADEVGRLEQVLDDAEVGVIGAFAVRDNAAGRYSNRVASALYAFGFVAEAWENRRPILFGSRYSFAGIGVKGAPRGSALQTWTPDEYRGRPGHPVVCGVVEPAA